MRRDRLWIWIFQLPKHKTDIQAAQVIIDLGWPTVEPVIGELLEWLQDLNWPVAIKLAPFLGSIGPPLIPHLRPILKTNDDIWKHWILEMIVQKSPEIADGLRDQLERMASSPTPGEIEEEVHLLAQDILHSLDRKAFD